MPVLLLIVGINFIGVGALIPVLPYAVIDTMGMPASVMTLLLASYAFAMFLANPVLGWLSDHYGRRRILFISLGISAVSHLWFAMSGDILTMFAARIISGLASGNVGVIQAMIADRSTEENRAQYMGFFGASIGVGFVAGPALGGLLGGLGGGPSHQIPFLLAAGVSLLALLLTLRLKAPPGSRIIPERGNQPLMQRITTLLRSPLALYAIASLLLNLSFAQVEASFVLVLRDYLDFGIRQTGWLFTYIGVCVVLVQAVLIRPVVAAIGEVGTSKLGIALLLVGQCLTTLAVLGMLPGGAYPLTQTIIATTGICFGYALSTPAISSAVSKIAGKAAVGGSLGTIQGFGSLGQVGGLVLAGPLYDLGGSQYPFGFGAVVTLSLFVILPFLARPATSSDQAGADKSGAG
ncbi:MAG: MFS transporter [Alphaproteobacteria bacterium]|nr:MFS transporter [Alphaproteobacteria bacterium]MBL6672244.1 MFS transporter [Alphaproteobacteria bacterium]